MVNLTNNFNKYVPHANDDKNCGYCLDQIDNTKMAVVHGGEGLKHPIHLDCFKEYIESKESTVNCMHCQMPFDIKAVKTQLNEIEHPFAKKVASAVAGVLGGIASGFILRHTLEPLQRNLAPEDRPFPQDLDEAKITSAIALTSFFATYLSTMPKEKFGPFRMPESIMEAIQNTLLAAGGAFVLGNIAESGEIVLGAEITFGSVALALGAAKAVDILYKRYMN